MPERVKQMKCGGWGWWLKIGWGGVDHTKKSRGWGQWKIMSSLGGGVKY